MMVTFKEENLMTFRHLFLKGYKDQRLGSYALYTKADVYDHIYYIINRVSLDLRQQLALISQEGLKRCVSLFFPCLVFSTSTSKAWQSVTLRTRWLMESTLLCLCVRSFTGTAASILEMRPLTLIHTFIKVKCWHSYIAVDVKPNSCLGLYLDCLCKMYLWKLIHGMNGK